jgi:alpha-amylase
VPSVCFYFQVHQPYRLKPYSVWRVGRDPDYFDDGLNRFIVERVAQKCYLPANRAILDLIRRTDGAFRCAYSITGTALEQMRRWAPAALASFQELAATGSVELIGETYYHSLAALYDVGELRAQVDLHGRLVGELFGQRPRVFRNTELIYDDRIGREAHALGFRAILAEGCDDVLGERSPDFVYEVAGASDTRLLCRNYRLSDDIAFRFSNRGWSEFPLTADRFAGWVHRVSGNGDSVHLFMDYETFGEHQWAETGIFAFLAHLPQEVNRHPDWGFHTPSEVVARYPSRGPLAFARTRSWADQERDLTAWRGNPMQDAAFAEVYGLKQAVLARGDEALLATWRRLQTSDHFYYMCTKWFADGDVHAYFSPYPSPYEASINYRNALADFAGRVGVGATAAAAAARE